MITEVFAGIPVAAIGPAREWWERFLGAPPDMLPHDREAAWKLAGSGWIYVVEDAERAGSGLLTLLVDDLDAYGLEIEDDIPGMRISKLTDPDGNRIQLGQPA